MQCTCSAFLHRRRPAPATRALPPVVVARRFRWVLLAVAPMNARRALNAMPNAIATYDVSRRNCTVMAGLLRR